ncbi:MAG: hypothetical protein OXM55_08570 [Bdellovibrionales bacterium]|nr:hypothetical protein [Bdellovibrionales bacterium]
MNISEKKQRFIELANKRVNKALKQISLISNLSNTNNYEYTQDEVKQIIRALESEIQMCKERFRKQDSEESRQFSLK